MVMETPSPQCVGREFVRQYYTLLNQAPAHLHRFYNNSSSFIHGGLDPPNRETTPVVGQKQIHQKIQQLNFSDCHAKISQVDSQATLGNGVVVQVTGELSNGGQPMRRFTQTFVLAFQAPKKYYVHNDIFRYQDMLAEEEYEEVTRTEIEEDEVIQHQNTLHSKTSQVVEEDRDDDWSAQPMVNGTSESHHHEGIPAELPPQTQPPPVSQPILPPVLPQSPAQPILQPPAQPILQTPAQPILQPPAQIMPSATPPMVQPPPQVPPVLPPQHTTTPQPRPEPPQEVSTPSNLHHLPSMIDQEDNMYNQAEAQEPPSISPQNSTGESNVVEVKTYANLVKGSSGNTPNPTYYTPPPQPVSPSSGLGKMDKPKPPRESRVFVRSDENVNASSDAGNFDSDRSRKPHYSDNQQLFMGNLPHYASETELKSIFGKFGNIVEMRILSKTGSKPGSRVPPNYGFIIFEHPSSVQAVLNAKSIIYPDESKTKLNVEEKKTKGSGGGGPVGGRGGGRPGGGRPSLGGGPPRGPPRSTTGPPPSSAQPQRQNFHRR